MVGSACKCFGRPEGERYALNDRLSPAKALARVDPRIRYAMYIREEERSPCGYFEWAFRRGRIAYRTRNQALTVAAKTAGSERRN